MILFSCFLQTACANDTGLINQPIGQIAEKDDVKFGFAVTYDGLKNNTEYQNIVKTAKYKRDVIGFGSLRNFEEPGFYIRNSMFPKLTEFL